MSCVLMRLKYFVCNYVVVHYVIKEVILVFHERREMFYATGALKYLFVELLYFIRIEISTAVY